MKGMIIRVYRTKSEYDCTNDGVSSKFDTLLLVGENVPPIFESNGDNLPVVTIKSRGDYRYLVPLNQPDGLIGPMFGGNFAYSSDGRVTALIGIYPIPIHDRFDTKEMYQKLTV